MRSGFLRKFWSATLLAFLVYLLVAVFFQWIGGAYTSELGEHADELGDRPARRLDALDQRSSGVRCGQLVMDMEAAYVCLDCPLSQYRRFTSSLLYFWPVTYAS